MERDIGSVSAAYEMIQDETYFAGIVESEYEDFGLCSKEQSSP